MKRSGITGTSVPGRCPEVRTARWQASRYTAGDRYSRCRESDPASAGDAPGDDVGNIDGAMFTPPNMDGDDVHAPFG
jgi:hypothetical protein